MTSDNMKLTRQSLYLEVPFPTESDPTIFELALALLDFFSWLAAALHLML